MRITMRKLPGIPSFMQNEPIKILCFGWEKRESRVRNVALTIGIKVAMQAEYHLLGLIKVITVEYWGSADDIALFKVNI